MSEFQPLLRELLAEADAGRSAALCVVVATGGSTPQCPGAALLLRADGGAVGTLGGGCVEAEVKRRALELLQRRRTALVELDLDCDYGWDDGLICGGHMSVAVCPITGDMDLAPFRQAWDAMRRHRAASLPLIVEQAGSLVRYQVHLEAPPTLLIAGAGHVGQAVANLARGLDFRVIVIDDRAEYAAPQRFAAGVELIVDDVAASLRRYPLDASCYVVIVTRGHRHDAEALRAVIGRPARYIGMIGSRRKVAMMFEELRQAGLPQEQIDRVHAPIGLPIRAVTVAEIAVSIAAQLIQVRRQDARARVEGPFEARST